MAKGFMDQSIGESEKKGLAASIIGKGNGTQPGTDETGSKLDGELHGDVRIQKAANGVVVTHTRKVHVPHKVKAEAKGDVMGGGPSDGNFKDHTHVFNHGDSQGILAHLNQIGVLTK